MGNLVSKFTSRSKSTTSPPEKMSPPPFSHYPNAQTEFKVHHSPLFSNPSPQDKLMPPPQPPLIANENAYLGDIFSSGPSTLPHTQPCPDASKPITCGLYRLEAGTPLVYEYTYHEMKIIVEGEFEISDETGQVVKGRKGDVFYFPKGSKITFKTETYGVGFFVGQRAVSFLSFFLGLRDGRF
jgi:uncharacterized cupin superfamily protein